MSQSSTDFQLPDMEGVGTLPTLQLPATKYSQGGRIQFHVNVPVFQVSRLVQKPDPSHPLEGNRKVDESRAKKFAQYVRKKPDWVAPAIIVRTDGVKLDFQSKMDFPNGTSWGILSIPHELLQKLPLLDGQHRSLGVAIAEDDARDQIRKLEVEIDRAKGREDQALRVKELNSQIAAEKAILERLRAEHFSVDIVEVSTEAAKQIFVDIANNAKGVNPDYTTVLDQSDVVNRIAVDVMRSHRLLIDNVEHGQERRMNPSNPNLLGAKSVADIVRAVLVGTGRVGSRVEERLVSEVGSATKQVEAFFDTVTGAFRELEDIAAGRLTTEQLRKKSLLGSSTMLRVLAATYHDLTSRSERPWARSEVEDYFRKLGVHMNEIPVKQTSMWMQTGAFIPGTTAPQARQGSIKALTDHLVEWATEGFPKEPGRSAA